VATKGMIPTSSRDLSIIMSVEVRFVKEKRTEERDWLVGRGRRGEVKDAARQLGPLDFVLFVWTSSELEIKITLPTHCLLNNALCAPCPEQVVEAGAEALAVETLLEPTIHLRWASLLLIYRPSQESRAHSTPYVFILHPAHSP
jgi:hypothetical protein